MDEGGSGGGWVARSFLLDALVAPTAQVRVRFDVADQPNDSVTEAGLDSFAIVRRHCRTQHDCNGNGIVDSDDIASGRSLDVDANGIPDECSPTVRGNARPAAGPPGAAPPRRVP